MSNYSKKDLDFFANKTLENYDSKNPSIIFKDNFKITNEDALIIQSNVARLREKRGEEIIGYKIGFFLLIGLMIFATFNDLTRPF